MKKILAIMLMSLVFHSAEARAQESGLIVTHTVTSVSSDATTITLDLLVTVTNNGPETVQQVSLRLPSPTGDDTAILGEIVLDAIIAGQSKSAGGVFTAPREFFEGSPLEILSWTISYLDAQGQTQTEMILGHKQP